MSAAATTAAAVAVASAAAPQVVGCPRRAPPLGPAKTRFNAYLEKIGLPSVDDLHVQPSDVGSPGNIQAILCGWGDDMVLHPPTGLNNEQKLVDADGVGNAYGLVKEYLKDRFP